MVDYGTYLLVPRQDKPDSLWKPGYWQRKHCFFTAIWVFMLLLVVLQISFTRFFATNATYMMLLLKVFWMGMEVIFTKTLSEMLIVLPYQASLQLTQFVMTLGAENFQTFVVVFLTEMSVGIVKR